ncbi:hypothetical protein IL38_23985 [Actinopolyspora erythraea]|uniref:Uncharacterized protein n=1 Tax=Actinopolyspora erythraea TaxID=414996 RepID=A0ABR4WY91_9ACTN|nr:hypothetical protein [Actinopolyspora erythraea]KGI79361.1 hypothetical protein IL38_23985 [Actinopolyspora erythraea]
MAGPPQRLSKKGKTNSGKPSATSTPARSDAQDATSKVLEQLTGEDTDSTSSTETPENGAESPADDQNPTGEGKASETEVETPETATQKATSRERGKPAKTSTAATAESSDTDTTGQPPPSAGSDGGQASTDVTGGHPEITPELLEAVRAQLAASGGTPAPQEDTSAEPASDSGNGETSATAAPAKRSRPRLSVPDLSDYEPEHTMTPREIERWRYSLDITVRSARRANEQAVAKHRAWVQEVAEALQAGMPLSEIESVAASTRYPAPTDEEIQAIRDGDEG